MGQVESVAEKGELDDMYGEVGGDGYWALFQESFDLAVKSIIRPPRSMYSTGSLGPKSFQLEGVTFQREDFSVRNRRGQNLVCSLWRRDTPLKDPVPCVIYMHGANGSRTEGLNCIRSALCAGYAFIAFDFSGSGMSDGEHVTYGWFEVDDYVDVLRYVAKTYGPDRAEGELKTNESNLQFSSVLPWGRNLGGAVALMKTHENGEDGAEVDLLPTSAYVIDSAYASLDKMVDAVLALLQGKGLLAPNFLLKMGFNSLIPAVKKAIKDEKFDPATLAPIDNVSKLKEPALFAACDLDMNSMAPDHMKDLSGKFGGKTYTLEFSALKDKDGNAIKGRKRASKFYEAAFRFLRLIEVKRLVKDAVSRGLSEEECVEKVMGSLIAGWRAKNLEEIVWEEKKQEESAVEKMAAPAKKVSMFDAAFEDDGEKKMRNTVLKYYEDIAQRHKGKAAKVAARMKRKNSARASLKKRKSTIAVAHGNSPKTAHVLLWSS